MQSVRLTALRDVRLRHYVADSAITERASRTEIVD